MKGISAQLGLLACLAVILGACGGSGGPARAKLDLSIDHASLAAATINQEYMQTVGMTVFGGTTPYVYSCSVSDGFGLSTSVSSPDSTSGVALCIIRGTPLKAGAAVVTFSVSDSAGASESAGPLTVDIPTPPVGVNWTSRISGTAANLYGVTYAKGTFVAVGDSGTILTSSDGVTWTSRNSGTADTVYLYRVAYGNGTFVAVGGSALGDFGTILTSPDGITWTLRSSGITSMSDVTYGNGIFVAVSGSGNGTILTSSDGVTWISRTPGTARSLTVVAYGNGTFVAVSMDGNEIFTSPDGITWTWMGAVPWNYLSRVTYGNGTFVAVGHYAPLVIHGPPVFGPSILTSPDGIVWTYRHAATNSGTYIISGVTYGNGTFVAVSVNGSIQTSPDGLTWAPGNPGTADISLMGVTYGNGTFVAVGNNGVIIQSDPM